MKDKKLNLLVNKPHGSNDIRYVVGPDLDIDLCKSLVAGDQVLMEVNGVRYVDGARNPMVASDVWEVVENEWEGDVPEGQLVLKHPKVSRPIVLDYSDLITANSPAVFKTTNDKQAHKELPDGSLFVILQMAAYRLPAKRVQTVFPMPKSEDFRKFDKELKDEYLKAGLLEDLVGVLGKLNKNGWGHSSQKRIALRANVPLPVVGALIDGEYETLPTVPDDQLTRLRIQCHWLPMLIKQNSFICHDIEREYVK